MNTAIFSTSDDRLVKSILGCNSRIKPKVVITNKPDSPVINAAKQHNIKFKCFDHRKHSDRVEHEKEIIEFLKEEGIEFIIFAHYNRLVTKHFVDKFRKKIINVHPSLLPDFKGANSYREAFNAGVKESGCTIHYVDEGIDTGEIILQKPAPRLENDSFDTFKSRVHDTECRAIQAVIYSMVV